MVDVDVLKMSLVEEENYRKRNPLGDENWYQELRVRYAQGMIGPSRQGLQGPAYPGTLR